MKVSIESEKGQKAITREVVLMQFRWSVKHNAFVFMVGIYDGVYEKKYQPNSKVIEFKIFPDRVKIVVENESHVNQLAEELLEQERVSIESLKNMRM